MKNFLLIIICLLVFPSMMVTDDFCCDYIATGYYQLIYEADIAYLMGNKEEAFNKITEAKKNCNLLEQPMYYEMSRYVELLSERNEFSEAVHYMTILVKDYGYSSEYFEKQDYFQYLNSNVNWSNIKVELDSLNKLFYAKETIQLSKKLEEMCANDQKVRKECRVNNTPECWQTMNKTDSINEKQMKEIFEQYGYPNERVIGRKDPMLAGRITPMIMHFEDTAYFKPVLLQFIKKGECPPIVLGSFVDSRQRMESRTDKFIYRMYDNEIDDAIWDIANLDNRRKSIGLPSMEMKHKRDSIMRILYN